MESVLQESCTSTCVDQINSQYGEMELAYGSEHTGNQLPVETYNPPTCLICDNTVTNGICIYSSEETPLGPITEVLGNILDQYIDNVKLHSNFLCPDCYNIVKDFHDYTLKIQQIKQNVLQMYDLTSQKHCKKVDEVTGNSQIVADEMNDELKSKSTKSNDMKKYECPMCMKRFRAFSHRVEHMLIHLNEKPHKCETCSKLFRTKSALKVHISSHTGVKKHTCNQCGKSYADRYYYEEHIRVHNGERPFKCEYCPRTFARRKDMMLHTRQHTNEKPFKCPHCAKAFVVKSRLDRHLRTHSGLKPFTCEYCPKAFTRKEDKAAHIRIHTGQKPFHCCYCDKTFANQSNCLVHIRGHSGGSKHLKCTKCDQKFSRKNQLQEHDKNCMIPKSTETQNPTVQEQPYVTTDIPNVSQPQLLQVQEIIQPFTIPQVAWGNTATIDTHTGTYNVTGYILN